MVFSSFTFLYLFLPVSLIAYYSAPGQSRNGVLLLISLLFYAWGAPSILPLLLCSCALDYLLSKKIAPNQYGDTHKAHLYLTLAIGSNLILLFYFKYTNFFLEQTNTLLQFFALSPFTWTAIVLPIGISFFTFQKISYVVDVYRGDTAVARSYAEYTLYVLLFPQLIAGPIVRYRDIAKDILQRNESRALFFSGLMRFCLGLAKKILIADAMGTVANTVFEMPIENLPSSWAWVGAIAYAYQIYFDFAGYSDMAIGLGWMFGFQFKENFNLPYRSKSITEFWRRWHISLSTFMREYLYIPLGGNRGSTFQTYRNLLLVFLLSGLWHGAAWTFVFWGLFHGFFLIVDRVFWLDYSRRLPSFVTLAITFVIVLVGWVLFRSTSLEQAVRYIQVLFTGNNTLSQELPPRGFIIDNRSIFVFLIATILAFNPTATSESIKARFALTTARSAYYGACILLLLTLSSMYLAARGYTPFLYFKF